MRYPIDSKTLDHVQMYRPLPWWQYPDVILFALVYLTLMWLWLSSALTELITADGELIVLVVVGMCISVLPISVNCNTHCSNFDSASSWCGAVATIMVFGLSQSNTLCQCTRPKIGIFCESDSCSLSWKARLCTYHSDEGTWRQHTGIYLFPSAISL